MKEWTALDCIGDIADMMYHRTGHKWWLRLGIDVAARKNRIWRQEDEDIQEK